MLGNDELEDGAGNAESFPQTQSQKKKIPSNPSGDASFCIAHSALELACLRHTATPWWYDPTHDSAPKPGWSALQAW